jgi:hypothetical protein
LSKVLNLTKEFVRKILCQKIHNLTKGFVMYSAVAFYVRDVFLKSSHDSRQVLKHALYIILADFLWAGGICSVSNF